MSSSAQTTFFSSSFPVLHQLVLDFLSEPDSPHPVLPFLQVSRYWRSFARDHLLHPFQKTKESVQGKPSTARSQVKTGAYVKFYLTSYFNQEVHKADDPRSYFTKGGGSDGSIDLLLSSIDPLTQICTFLPAGSYDSFPYTLLCDVETRAPYDEICPSFGLVPSTWFVPSDKKAKRRSALFGKEVAFNRNTYPTVDPFEWSPQPVEPGGVGEVKHGDNRGRWAKGWGVEFKVTRLDTKKTKLSKEDKSFGMFNAPAKLKFTSAKIPLFQLYHPYGLDEESGYSSGEGEF
ncbi:hypothetical protein BDY24DRAFT_440763 [Mrakia frigida]|uniref:uncharacterized protein n=1 Tax=Mrakia frigida TaxID=29902 RepID=UPI003FCBEE5E